MPIVSSTTIKKNNDTGANDAIWLANGPGCSLSGIAIAMFTPETRWRYSHFSAQPSAVRCLDAGEIASSGKSIASKLVRMASLKLRTSDTPLPKW